MRQYTFERVPNVGTYQSWVTLRFEDNGSLTMLSRDPIRSTRKVWALVGRWDLSHDGGPCVLFDKDTDTIRIAATHLSNSAHVVGATVGDYATQAYSPESDGYHPRLTVPATIRSKLEGSEPDRNRSLDLGLHAKGREIAAQIDPATMENMAQGGESKVMRNQALAAMLRRR